MFSEFNGTHLRVTSIRDRDKKYRQKQECPTYCATKSITVAKMHLL